MGEVVEHQRHGQGAMKFQPGSEKSHYVGSFVRGKITGQGQLKYINGEVYKGEFLDGVLCGHGTVTKPNGDVISGMFVDGKLTGIDTLMK